MPKRFALVVGVDAYPGNPLTKCVKDARDVSATLQLQEYGFQVTELLDEEVTRRRFAEYVNIFFREEADFYVLYFSGHGWSTDMGVHLVTVDADEIDQGTSLDSIRNLITNVAPQGASVLLMLDCCHSGAALPSSLPDSGIRVRSDDVLKSMVYLPEGRALIAACMGDEVAFEGPDLEHSVFTEFLLSGLLGEAADINGESGVFTSLR